MIAIDFGIGVSIGGVVGFIIRELIGDRMARDRALEAIRITEFNKGASAFRLAFVDVICLLKQSIEIQYKGSRNIVSPQVLIDHEKAKMLFEPFITSSDLQGFNTAWENYKNYEDNYLGQGKPFNSQKTSDRQAMCQYCLDQINYLLAYAKPKT